MNCNTVILGGGVAGWLTALVIQKSKPGMNITVVEDPNKPPIIAGESGTTTFVDMLKYLDIDFDDFVAKANATPKLGGRFKDWSGVGSEFIHCLQTDYAPWLDGWSDNPDASVFNMNLGQFTGIIAAERQKNLYQATLLGNEVPLADAFYANYFIKENKVPFGASKSELPIIAMWHNESRATAAYLKEVALKRDITLIEGTYVDAKQNDKGDITTLILDDNREIEGEWFVDCTGFAQLLIRKKLGAEYSDYSDHFTHNSVIAWWDEPKYSVTTNATAMKYGWRWNINLQHRSGNGYIYDNNYITADQALEEARSVCGEHIEPVASFTYTPEVAKESWKNNVFAIGLSSGFLEPLEANGIAVICESLYAMQDLWDPTRRDHTLYRDRFNHRVNTVYEDIKDFIALHFRGRRDDTDFWKSHIHDPERIPESLAMKLKDWDHYWQGLVGVEPVFNGYSPAAWMQVIQGLHIFPNTYFSTAFENKLETGRNVLNTNVKRYKELVAPFWTIDEWIKNIDK